MNEQHLSYGPADMSTDAALAALALLRSRLEAASPEEATGACVELVEGWVRRFGPGGMPLLAAQLVEQAVTVLVPGDRAGALERVGEAEMELLSTGPGRWPPDGRG
jgi:hypothetical protein